RAEEMGIWPRCSPSDTRKDPRRTDPTRRQLFRRGATLFGRNPRYFVLAVGPPFALRGPIHIGEVPVMKNVTKLIAVAAGLASGGIYALAHDGAGLDFGKINTTLQQIGTASIQGNALIKKFLVQFVAADSDLAQDKLKQSIDLQLAKAPWSDQEVNV